MTTITDVGPIIFLKIAGVELLFYPEEIAEAKKRVEDLNEVLIRRESN